MKGIIAAPVVAGSVAAPIAAHAALLSTDGGLGVYDSANNVTWTSNANLFATQAATYGGGAAALVSAVIADSAGVISDTPNSGDTVPYSGTYTLSASDFNTGGPYAGQMDWWGAQAWVHYLNVIDYGGSNQWALSTTVDNLSSSGFPDGAQGDPSQSSSQLAQLFYGGLGETAGSFVSTTHNVNYELFNNMQCCEYWSGTENSAHPGNAWAFSTNDGAQGTPGKQINDYVLAVSPGDINPVPLPATAWLLLSAIGVLGIAGRRRRVA